MIRVRLTLSGPLRNHYLSTPSARGEDVEMRTGSSVSDLLARYGIPPEKAHMIVINRLKGSLESRLENGHHVRIIPLAAGG